MSEYMSIYAVNGCLRPEYKFSADNAREGRRIAEKQIEVLMDVYGTKDVTLVDLVRIRHIKLKKKDRKIVAE